MPRPSCLPFTIADGMILMVGLATGLAITKLWGVGTWYPYLFQQWALIDSFPVLVGLSLALFALRLREPRPRFWRLVRQPGTAALLSVIGVILLNIPSLLVHSREYTALYIWLGELRDLPDPRLIGKAVIFSWATLFLTRALRPERGWIDRSGRILGCIFIGLWVIELIR